MAETPQEVLREAADYIGEHGWTQGSYRDYDGGVCALGAIASVTGSVVLDCNGDLAALYASDLGDQAVKILKASLSPGKKWPRSVPNWNDDPGRTAEDVIL